MLLYQAFCLYMNYRKICFFILPLIFSTTVFSQVTPSLRDTIKETIIFEYDTVYLKPDTIRMTDTILNIIHSKPVKKPKPLFHNFSFFSRGQTTYTGSAFTSTFLPNSIGIAIVPFVAGNPTKEHVSDSLTTQPLINVSFCLKLNYMLGKRSIFSVGAGFTPFHEMQHSQRTYYARVPDSNRTDAYDSLLIREERTYNYYYNFLNLYLLYGRKWNVTDNLYVSINAGCTVDLLLDFKQGHTNRQPSETGKFYISLIISPSLSYKLSNNIEFCLSPFYQHSLGVDKKYPHSFFQKTGVEAGINIIL